MLIVMEPKDLITNNLSLSMIKFVKKLADKLDNKNIWFMVKTNGTIFESYSVTFDNWTSLKQPLATHSLQSIFQ